LRSEIKYRFWYHLAEQIGILELADHTNRKWRNLIQNHNKKRSSTKLFNFLTVLLLCYCSFLFFSSFYFLLNSFWLILKIHLTTLFTFFLDFPFYFLSFLNSSHNSSFSHPPYSTPRFSSDFADDWIVSFRKRNEISFDEIEWENNPL
jgi:hypothetical protein